MNGSQGANEFRARWVAEFSRQAQGSRNPAQVSAWEGNLAYQELEKKNLLWLALPPPLNVNLLDILMSRLYREVVLYQSFAEDIVPTNCSFKDAIDALRGAEKRLRRAHIQGTGVSNTLRNTVEQYASRLEKTRRTIEKQMATYWHDVFLAVPAERMRWSVYFDDKGEVHSLPPREVKERAKVFEAAKYPPDLVKRIDLDTRFQVRVAVILRLHFLKKLGISLQTISRMTVLTYLCGNLGQESHDRLIVAGRKTPITVSTVDAKLRDADLR